MIQSLVWLLIIEFIGLLALPAAFAFFSFLPDRGYTLAKTFGLLGGAFLVWFLGMLGLPFTALTSWVLFIALFGGLSFWLLRRKQGQLRVDIDRFFRDRLWFMVAVEILFILAYFYLINMRSYMPEIRDQEKFGDFAFLNSMALHSKLPPADPWMSGYTINYYYFSHFMMAMLTKMSGVAPAIAFNLCIPLIFALTAIGAFGLVYNLVMVARRNARGWQAAGFVGLLGLAGVCILGNLDSARIALFPGSGQTLGSFTYNWWEPSRVISDYMPQPVGNGLFQFRMTEAITEFPMFSFLLADIHPHVMTLPFVLLVLGAAFNLLRIPAGAGWLNLRTGEGRYFFVLLASMVGSLYFLNSLDFPTYLLLVVLAAGVRELRVGGQEVSSDEAMVVSGWVKPALLGGNISVQGYGIIWRRTARWLGFTVRLLLASVALYLPFYLTFTNFVGGEAIVPDAVNLPVLATLAKTFLLVAWDRTPLLVQDVVTSDGEVVQRWGYLMVFGLFLYPIVCMVALKLWPYLKAPYAYLDVFKVQGSRFKAGEAEEAPEEEGRDEARPPFGSTAFYVAGFGLLWLLLSEVMSFLHLNPVIGLIVGITATPVLAAGVGMLAADYLARIRAQRPARELLIALGIAAFLMTALGWMLNFQLYGPLIMLGVSAILLILFEFKVQGSKFKVEEENSELGTRNPELTVADQFGLLLVALTVIITFTIEIIFLRDIFNARFNTIFKFYYQAWVMYAIAGAYAAWRVIAWGWKLAPFRREAESEETEPLSQVSPAPARPVFQPQRSLQLGMAGANGANVAFSLYPSPAQPAGYSLAEEPLLDEEAEAAEEYVRYGPRRSRWRWVWALGLTLLLLAGLVYPIFGPYEKTGHYKDRKGLDGEEWLSQWYPEDYAAIKWLRTQAANDPNFEGPILETIGPDWFDYNRVGTFSGFPVLMGWPGHEQQWRGGKADTRAEVYARMEAVDRIYNTTNVDEAKRLLKQYNIKYVYVGTLETGARDGRWYDGSGQPIKKNYAPEALTKFSLFMNPIYQKDGVTIYSF